MDVRACGPRTPCLLSAGLPEGANLGRCTPITTVCAVVAVYDVPSLIRDLELVKTKHPPNAELFRLRFRTLVVY